jgi:hypothetical protein
MKKNTGWPIEENIDSVLKWMAQKHRRVWTLIREAKQIDVRVLLEGDARITLVTAEVPKNLWKWRAGTEFL